MIHVTGVCRLSFEEEMQAELASEGPFSTPQVLTMCRHYREKLLLVTREVDALRRDQGQMLKKFKGMLEEPCLGGVAGAPGLQSYADGLWGDGQGAEEVEGPHRAAPAGRTAGHRGDGAGGHDPGRAAGHAAEPRGVGQGPRHSGCKDVLMLQNRERYMEAVEEPRAKRQGRVVARSAGALWCWAL